MSEPSTILRAVEEAPEQANDLVPPDAEEAIEAGGGEQLLGGDAAEAAPVVAVRGADHGQVVVADVLVDEDLRAVGKGRVGLREAFRHQLRRRHHHAAAEAELEGEDGAGC